MRLLLRPVRQLATTFLSWLSNVPIDDPIDRRNAPTMQLLFFVVGTTLPISWARHLAVMSLSPGWRWVMAMDLITSALALVGIALIRTGHFRRAISLFLGSLLVGLLVAYLNVGFRALLPDQTSQMLSLVIGGLVLGRRSLWLVFFALIAVFVSGFTVDASQAPVTAEQAFHNLPSVTFSYFVITLILDRTLTALRETLGESEARGRLLQQEMRERERAQTHLVHSQKMEAAGRLASGVAHDFSNILGIVLGFAAERHRLDDPDIDPKRDLRAMSDALEGIESAARLGEALSKRLLSFGRRDLSEPESFDARGELWEVRPMLRQLFPPNILLEFHVGDEPLPVYIDKGQFDLAILNIAANARDAMPDGGAFVVSAKLNESLGSIEIRLADNGSGIGEAAQHRIFEPFFSTKPGGSGLGLSIAYTLISRAEGDITLSSAPGLGTSFCIRLPTARRAL